MPSELFAAANDPSNSPWSIIAIALGSFGGVGGLVALLTVGSQKRRLGTQADGDVVQSGVVVTQAALDQMQAAIAQSARDSKRALEESRKNDQLEARVDELESEHRRYVRNAEEHRRWDDEMVLEVRRLGGHPKDPPPLFPLGAA